MKYTVTGTGSRKNVVIGSSPPSNHKDNKMTDVLNSQNSFKLKPLSKTLRFCDPKNPSPADILNQIQKYVLQTFPHIEEEIL